MAESDSQTEKLKNLLECPICFEISKPPIYACVIGHLICKDCVPKVDLCPICRSKYAGTRNFTAEQLSLTLSALENCEGTQHIKKEEEPNIDNLIQRVKTNVEYLRTLTHFEDPNEFRPITCCLFADECKNSTVDFFSYFDHLRDTHKVYSCGTGCSLHTKRQNVKGNQFVRNGSSKLFIMNCFDRHFLISMHQENQFVWIWAALHGSEEETSGFIVQITIKHKYFEDITWRGEVHDIRKTFIQINASNSFLKVKTEDLRKRVIKFGWMVQAHILENTASDTLENLGNAINPRQQVSSALPSPETVQTQYYYPSTRPPVRPPLPRSQSLSLVRQPVITKGAAPPIPSRPTTRLSISSISTSQTSQMNRPKLESIYTRPSEPFQALNSNDRTRAFLNINRIPEERPRSFVYSQPTTSTGFRPLTWETATASSASDSTSRRRATIQNSGLSSVKSVKERSKDPCVIL